MTKIPAPNLRRKFSLGAETKRASISVDDIVARTFQVRSHRDNMYTDNIYTLVRENKGRLSLRDEKDELGALVPASPWIGLIWKGSACLGQYSVEGDEDLVYPHHNGKYLGPIKIHPLDYLLDSIENTDTARH